MSDQILGAAEAVSIGLSAAIRQISTLGVESGDEPQRDMSPRKIRGAESPARRRSFGNLPRSKSLTDEEHSEGIHGKSARRNKKGVGFFRRSKQLYNRATPMARMRDSKTQETLAMKEENSPTSTPVQKTLEEVKAEKQRKWRSKMKLAQQKQQEERRNLEGTRKKKREPLPENQLATLVGATVLDLIRHCGAADDASSSDESGGEDSVNSSESGYERKSVDSSEQKENEVAPKKKISRSPINHGESTVSPPDHKSVPQHEHQHSTPPRDQVSPHATMNGSPRFDSVASNSPASTKPSGNVLEETALRPVKTLNPEEFTSASIDPRSRDFIQAFVYDITNHRMRLLWHKDKDALQPVVISLGLDMGNKTILGFYTSPAISWLEQDGGLYGVNIFSAFSLERANPDDLKDYPFAMPSRTVCLRVTPTKSYMFETSSENQAYRLVHGLRWLIARLSFNLVIGNADVASEVLNIGTKTPKGTQVHMSLLEEARRARAMDDLSDQLLESVVVNRAQ